MVPRKFSVLIGILSGVLGAAIFWGVQMLVQPAPLRIATLSVRALIDTEIARIAKSKLSNGEAAEHVRTYGKRLSQLAEQLARERHLVLLPESAVITGAVDVTSLIQSRLEDLKQMK